LRRRPTQGSPTSYTRAASVGKGGGLCVVNILLDMHACNPRTYTHAHRQTYQHPCIPAYLLSQRPHNHTPPPTSPHTHTGISYGLDEISCTLSIRVWEPFDGSFELKLSDGTDTYSSNLTLDDAENIRCAHTHTRTHTRTHAHTHGGAKTAVPKARPKLGFLRAPSRQNSQPLSG
jgi:hypothetical protein